MTKEISKNYDYCKQTINLRNTLEQGFLVLAERLHKIYENKLYEGGWDDWRDFLEDIKFDNVTASKLIKIHQMFVLEYGIPKKMLLAVGREIAYELTGVVKSKEDAMQWLEKGGDLRREDVRIALKEHKTGIPMEACHHDFYTLKVCRKNCGYREIISA